MIPKTPQNPITRATLPEPHLESAHRISTNTVCVRCNLEPIIPLRYSPPFSDLQRLQLELKTRMQLQFVIKYHSLPLYGRKTGECRCRGVKNLCWKGACVVVNKLAREAQRGLVVSRREIERVKEELEGLMVGAGGRMKKGGKKRNTENGEKVGKGEYKVRKVLTDMGWMEVCC